MSVEMPAQGKFQPKNKMDDSGTVRLSNGLNEVTINLSGSPTLPEKGFYVINIDFSWLKASQGSFGEISIYHSGMKLVSRRLNAYGRTLIYAELRGVRSSSELQINLAVDRLPTDLRFNDAAFDFQLGEISVNTISIREEISAARGALAHYAMATAEYFGLRGIYMIGERRSHLEDRICTSLSRREPFSVVRVGDGEGRVLGYPLYFSQSEVLAEVLYYHFGPRSVDEMRRNVDGAWIDDLMGSVRELIQFGIDSADVVGFPVYDFFRGIGNGVTSGMIGYGCATHYVLGRFPEIKKDDAVGTNVFQQLAELPDFFARIALYAKSVSTVGPWDLSAPLAEALGVQSVEHLEVPRHYTWSSEKRAGQFPLLYKSVEARLLAKGNLQGQLFLVGAGLLGKYYCGLIKQMGGVALDVGSIFDSWAMKGLPYAVENGERIKLSNLTPKL